MYKNSKKKKKKKKKMSSKFWLVWSVYCAVLSLKSYAEDNSNEDKTPKIWNNQNQ